ncbi:CTP synthetase [Ureaplasma diversum]|uniref:CTP synthase (glutamine hydrolyzing) n=1 Tax=Ureaplasma diversum TaxID=42094 RepID=A0A0C5RC58_9BACT|nr:CTP synthase [Ureaplasma diversum]AJQ45476.1 CTP synthetase [Ureaplasma diversum]
MLKKADQKTKYIFVTGGVYSSLGKGVSASSIGRILVELGYKVAMQKLDPYLNIDPTYLSPYQHGEVFVTKDGKEADLDLGSYERFINLDLNEYSSVTSGKIYYELLLKERNNGFEGKTVQTIPHVTGAIIDYIIKIKDSLNPDFVIVEIGGTVGDYESLAFIEAIAQFKHSYGANNVLCIHCSPLIYINNVQELKTKPTQNSVKLLRSLGVNPDLLLVRSEVEVDDSTLKKLAWSCAIDESMIFASYTADSVYLVPNSLFAQKIHISILDYFNIDFDQSKNIDNWTNFTKKITEPKKHKLNVGLVGKFVELPDAYKSVIESLLLASYELSLDLKINYIQPNEINKDNIEEKLKRMHCLLFPTISGDNKGFDGALLAMQFAREFDVPTLAFGTGINILVADYIKNELNQELVFNQTSNNNDFSYVINGFVLNDKEIYRVGEYESKVLADSLLNQVYNTNLIYERHRHHIELDSSFVNQHLLANQWLINATSTKNNYIDAINYTPNKFHLGLIYNPEYNSKPNKVNPCFIALLKACLIIK